MKQIILLTAFIFVFLQFASAIPIINITSPSNNSSTYSDSINLVAQISELVYNCSYSFDSNYSIPQNYFSQCYQESMNETHITQNNITEGTCGLSKAGQSISQSGTFWGGCPSATVWDWNDNNISTCVGANTGSSIDIRWYYVKPTSSIGAIWRFREGWANPVEFGAGTERNVTIPDSCWFFNSTALNLRFIGSTPSGSSHSGAFQCLNATGYSTIYYNSVGGLLFDEGIHWYNATLPSINVPLSISIGNHSVSVLCQYGLSSQNSVETFSFFSRLPVPPPFVPEYESNPIYQSLSSTGVGFSLFIQSISQFLPFFLLLMIILAVLLGIIYFIIILIKKHILNNSR